MSMKTPPTPNSLQVFYARLTNLLDGVKHGEADMLDVHIELAELKAQFEDAIADLDSEWQTEADIALERMRLRHEHETIIYQGASHD